MSRVYFIQDAQGERRISGTAFPLHVGGAGQGGVVLPEAAESDLLALLALADGYAYVQPVDDAPPLFLNHELLSASTWLKSGDRLQIGEHILTWTVKGDQVFIRVSCEDQSITPAPPADPPPHRMPSRGLPVTPRKAATRGGRPLRRILIVLFTFLMLALVLLLLAVPVGVQVTPAPEFVELQGFPPPVSFGERRLVLPGRYYVRASLQGYQPLDETVDVTRQGPHEFNFTLQELPGEVTINPEPLAELRLWVDEQPVELTPAGVAQIQRGSHRLRFETERYLPVDMQFEVDGLGQSQTISFQLQPAWAQVFLSSQPTGAQVSVDDHVVGVTPLQTDILQGAHRIQLELNGYKAVQVQKEFQAGQNVRLDEFVLQANDGELLLSSTPEGATVTVDNRYYGTTPVSLQLASGIEHSIRLSRSGYLQSREQLTLKADESRALEMKLAPQYGTVFLSTVPADASVLVDGTPSASGPRLRLTIRSHRVVVSKPGYVTKKVNVIPEAGVSKTLKIVLDKKGSRPPSEGTATSSNALPATRSTSTGEMLRLVQPAGVLAMGASRREAGRRANESRRKVQLDRPFYLSTHEVSNASFRRFRASHNSGSLDGATLNADRQPVVKVSWDDAVRYCNWLSKQDGLPQAYVEKNGQMQLLQPVNTGYRLPTEAEWAYVARRLGRQSESRYPWSGNYPPGSVVGNYAGGHIADTLTDVVPGYDDGYRGTAPVGSFAEWPTGFFDLGGNVAEWVNDYYTVYPGEADRLVRDPSGPVSGEHHVVRGAGWRHGNITELRLSYRDYSKKPRYDLGFRIARYAR